MTRLAIGPLLFVFAVAGCLGDRTEDVESEQLGLSGAARRPRSEAIRDVAAGEGMTNGALLAGIAQVETGLSHCWSEATWACQGLNSPSCGGGPVIAGASDGPCSAQQGGLGMFQFDGGTFQQTIARDGEEVLLLEGNIAHAVEFVAARVREDIPGVNTTEEAIAWLNSLPVQAGNAKFEQWIELVSCRYNGCCGCSSQEGKYRDATIAARDEFEAGFWSVNSTAPQCEPIAAETTVLEENDTCAVAGGEPQFWRSVSNVGSGDQLLWTHTTDNASPANFARWNLDLLQAGRYRLEVATDGGVFAQSRQAAYRVFHAGNETEVVIDQAAVDGYQLLGEFDFAAGGDQWVRLDDNTGEPVSTETKLAFDALRVSPASSAPPTDDDPPADDPGDPNDPSNPNGDGEGGVAGCQLATGSNTGAAAPPLLLLALALAARRRRR